MKFLGTCIFFLNVCSLALLSNPSNVCGQPSGGNVRRPSTRTDAVTAAVYDVRPRAIQLVPAGTIVGNGPPEGWSHLVIKSNPHCNRGDLDDVAQRDINLASLFDSVLLANVAPAPVVGDRGNQRRWSIRNIGIGTTTPINGQDVVVQAGQTKELGAKLSILARVLLKEIDWRQRQLTVHVTSPHFAIVDINAAVRFKRTNQQMMLRYALIVEPTTGQLVSFVWLLKPGTTKHRLASAIRLLRENQVEECSIYVDKSEYSWGIPSENAFAVTDIPKAARAFRPTEAMVPAMQRRALSVADAAQLDRNLRKLIK